MESTRYSAAIAAAWVLASVTAPLRAAVKTDGSLGRGATLVGPNYTVAASLGQQRGGNLFHSFSVFDLGGGESATFTGPASVANVIARVTGGRASQIDGRIECDIPNASLFIINPAGVVIGADATLNVKGSFAASTADSVRLGGSQSFNTGKLGPGVLSSAPPSAFGFLRASGGGITVEGSTLTVPRGKSLSLIGGPVRIDHGRLIAPSGQINLVATASAGVVKGNVGVAHSAVDASSFPLLGQMSIAGQSFVTLDGPGGGAFVIRAGNLTVDASTIVSKTSGEADGLGSEVSVSNACILSNGATVFSDTIGTGRGGSLKVVAGTVRLLSGGRISANTEGVGGGGDLRVTANAVLIDNSGNPPPHQSSGITLDSNYQPAGGKAVPLGAGRSGSLTLKTSTLTIVAGGQITADTEGAGRGGNLTLDARDFTINNAGDPFPGVMRPSNVSADTHSFSRNAGRAGDVAIHARNLSLSSNAVISADTVGAGRGGDVKIDVDSLAVRGAGDHPLDTASTGISTHSAVGASGSAGNVTIEAQSVDLSGGAVVDAATLGGRTSRGGNLSLTTKTLSLETGAQISVDTIGRGPGGSMLLDARAITIDGANSRDFTTISAGTQSIDAAGGAGGNMVVHVNSLRLLNGGVLSAGAGLNSTGNAGNISVFAHALVIDGFNPLIQGIDEGGFASQLTSRSFGSGAAGNVEVAVANNLVVTNGGVISASARFNAAGNVAVTAGGSIVLDRGTFSTATAATGGNIRVAAPLFVTLRNGAVIRTNSADANGGNITIDPLRLTLSNGSTINASGGGNGGNIALSADQIPGAVFRGPGRNVVATGGTGVNGSIGTGPDRSDVAQALARLPDSLLSLGAVLQPQCGSGQQFSSFSNTGKGGLSLDPVAWQTGNEQTVGIKP